MPLGGPRYRRTSHGLYLPVDIDGSVPEQRIVEAAAVLPAYGGVTGWARAAVERRDVVHG